MYLKLKELIHTKVNEVFLEYQKEHSIISGDIDPFDAQRIDQIEIALSEVVKRVVAYQQKKMLDDFTPSWYIYTNAEGIADSETFGQITEDQFFTKVSKRIAFDDIDDITVQKIYFRGKEVEYAGWQPGMKYEYKDLNGNTIWVGEFPEWDH
jgi:hypothetical protein